MDRKLLLKVIALILLLFGAGILLATGVSYWEYSSYGIFIDFDDRFELILSGIAGVVMIIVAVLLPKLFKNWSNEAHDKEWRNF